MHHYTHHIGDYRRDTMHLSLLEHGCYRQLLDMYYLSETPIPKETQTVSRRLCARTQDEQNAIETVLNEFFSLTEEGWVHGRCDREIASYEAKCERNKLVGKLGGRPKKTQTVSKKTQTVNSGFENETQNNPNQEPITNNQVNRFAEFWAAYPVKKAKPAAEKAWAKAGINGEFDSVLAKLKTQASACKDLAYFPHASTWLNGRRWEDELQPVADRPPVLAL